MVQAIINFFQQYIVNEYILLFVLSAFPLIEMRGAVILSVGMNVNYFLVFLICGMASSLVSIPLLFLFNPFMNALKNTKTFNRIALSFEDSVKIKAKSVKKEKEHNKNSIYWALFAFIAVPLPFTGVWTGSCIGAFLGLDYWKTVAYITAGNYMACGILLLVLLTAKNYVDIILIVFLSLIFFSIILLAWQKLITGTKTKTIK